MTKIKSECHKNERLIHAKKGEVKKEEKNQDRIRTRACHFILNFNNHGESDDLNLETLFENLFKSQFQPTMEKDIYLRGKQVHEGGLIKCEGLILTKGKQFNLHKKAFEHYPLPKGVTMVPIGGLKKINADKWIEENALKMKFSQEWIAKNAIHLRFTPAKPDSDAKIEKIFGELNSIRVILERKYEEVRENTDAESKFQNLPQSSRFSTGIVRWEYFFKDKLEVYYRFYKAFLKIYTKSRKRKYYDRRVEIDLMNQIRRQKQYLKAAQKTTWQDFYDCHDPQCSIYEHKLVKDENLQELPEDLFPKDLYRVPVVYRLSNKFRKQYPEDNRLLGRYYAYIDCGGYERFGGMQSFSSELRAGITCKANRKLYKDTDLENCYPNILERMIFMTQKLGLHHKSFSALKTFVLRRSEILEGGKNAFIHHGKDGKCFGGPKQEGQRKFEDFLRSLDPNYPENEDKEDQSTTSDEIHDTLNTKEAKEMEFEELLMYLPKEFEAAFHRFTSKKSTQPDRDTIKKFCLCIYFGVHIGYASWGFKMLHNVCQEKVCEDCQEGQKRKQNYCYKEGETYSFISKSVGCKENWDLYFFLKDLIVEIAMFKQIFFDKQLFPFELLNAFEKHKNFDNWKDWRLEKLVKNFKQHKKKWYSYSESKKKHLIKLKRNERKRMRVRKTRGCHMSYWLSAWERTVITRYIQFLESKGIYVDCIIHDGFLVRDTLHGDWEKIKEEMYTDFEEFIAENLGMEFKFHLAVTVKSMDPTAFDRKVNKFTSNQMKSPDDEIFYNVQDLIQEREQHKKEIEAKVKEMENWKLKHSVEILEKSQENGQLKMELEKTSKEREKISKEKIEVEKASQSLELRLNKALAELKLLKEGKNGKSKNKKASVI